MESPIPTPSKMSVISICEGSRGKSGGVTGGPSVSGLVPELVSDPHAWGYLILVKGPW